MNYQFKKEKREEIRKFNLMKIAEIVGIDKSMLYNTVNGHRTVTKVYAFSITKALNEDAEIDYYFDSVNYE